MGSTAHPASTISGATRLFAVLGDPILQVRAPVLLNGLFETSGVDAVLVPVHARPGELVDVVKGLQAIRNLDGMLITVPHKVSILQFAHALSPAVRLAGSANALRREPDGRWCADNFDGAGFVRGLARAEVDVLGKWVLLVGAGGAGGAIAAAVLEAGAARLVVSDHDDTKVASLLSRLERRWPGKVSGGSEPNFDSIDIAVNATPLGLSPDDPLPFEPSELPASAVVADIIMKPRETPLLKAASALDLRVHHGSHMLDHQLELYRSFFRIGQGGDVGERTSRGVV